MTLADDIIRRMRRYKHARWTHTQIWGWVGRTRSDHEISEALQELINVGKLRSANGFFYLVERMRECPM